jgi:hypothetical protein
MPDGHHACPSNANLRRHHPPSLPGDSAAHESVAAAKERTAAAKARAAELTAVAGSLLLYSAVRDGEPARVGAAH